MKPSVPIKEKKNVNWDPSVPNSNDEKFITNMNYFFKDLLITEDLFFKNNINLFHGLAAHNIDKVNFIHVSLSCDFDRKRISNAIWICYDDDNYVNNGGSIFIISVMGYKHVWCYTPSISEMKIKNSVRISNTIQKFKAFYKQSKKFKKKIYKI